jgi:MFS family permease
LTLWRWLAVRDPHGYALKRAVRAAVVVPAVFAIGSQAIGNAQLATFGAFGSFALLLFVNFPGGRAARLGAYAVLGAAGVVLISLGTTLATPSWLAVVAMIVIAFGVLFAGVISSTVNAGTQAAMLSFILAIMLPGVRSDLPDRLAGWGIAFAICVPVAVLVWPPRDQDVVRERTAVLCRALAAALRLDQPEPGTGDTLVAMRRAGRELREAFRTSATRTTALSTGARLLIRLVEELEWLATTVTNACGDRIDAWPEQGSRLREVAARVLDASGDVLDYASAAGPDEDACFGLESHLAELEDARRAVSQETLAELRARAGMSDGPVRGEFDRPLYAAHELGYAIALAGRTVARISAADSRSWWARLRGRRVATEDPGVLAVAQHVATGRFDRHSVWLQSSVRGAVGLGFAVLLARMVDAQNAFWIGLGALSVLRSNALSTGSTVLRALLGTVVGFAAGGAIVGLLGTDQTLLWSLLPAVILVAAVAPAVISFAAGQAAFTVLVIILFNIIAPAGWRIGVLRVEDVGLGCLASLVAGVLLWPRGAAAALGVAFGEAYHAAAAYLQQAIYHVSGSRRLRPDAGAAAAAAGDRLDDALRQYLAERGTKRVPLHSVAVLANGAARLRLAGTAIARLQDGAPDAAGPGLDAPVEVLARRAQHVIGWYTELADGFARSGVPLPSADGATSGESFLDVVLPALDGCRDADRATRAEQLLWSGQYLGDVDQLRADLLEPAAQVDAARARKWWQL